MRQIAGSIVVLSGSILIAVATLVDGFGHRMGYVGGTYAIGVCLDIAGLVMCFGNLLRIGTTRAPEDRGNS